MEPNVVMSALVTMGGLGALFAGGLALADRKLRVEEDPRIAEVAERLPGANCGGCALAGCQDFAVKVVAGAVPISGCPVGGQEVAAEIGRILGVDPGARVRMVARVLCRGGTGVAVRKADYVGPPACRAAALVAGGAKACLHGCLGGGDCVDACQFGAMVMNEQGLPDIVDALCTGCGACVRACPRQIIELHPEDRDVFVICRNHDDPKTAKKVCSAACLACGICSRKSNGAVAIEAFLATIDYERLDPDVIPFDKCRTGAMHRLCPPAPPEGGAGLQAGA